MSENWWDAGTEAQLLERLDGFFSTVEPYHARRIAQYCSNIRQYELNAKNNSLHTMYGISTTVYGQSTPPQVPIEMQLLRKNITQSCVDTLQARIAAELKPLPYWLPAEGSYQVRRRAKQLNRFSRGWWQEQKMNAIGIDAFKDAEILGDSVTQLRDDHGKIVAQRVSPVEIYIDEIAAAVTRELRQIHRVIPTTRGRALAIYGDKKLLREADAEQATGGTTQTAEDIIIVRESWRLPDGPGGHGKWVASTRDGVIASEAWVHDWLPFVIMPYVKRPAGFWSMSLCEVLAEHQQYLNKLVWGIYQGIHRFGGMKMIYQEQSLNPDEISNNTQQEMVGVKGSCTVLPQWLDPKCVPPEMYAECRSTIQDMYEISGVSRMAASSVKPEGLNSGKAIRAYEKISSDRFATQADQYEAYHVEVVKTAALAIKSTVDRGVKNSYKVHLAGLTSSNVVDWKQLDFDRDSYTLIAYPVNAMLEAPSSKLDDVEERSQAGIYQDRSEILRLLGLPDTDAADVEETAAREWVEKQISKMVDDGDETVMPDVEDDLKLTIKLVSAEIQRAKTGDLEPERIQLLRDYLEVAKSLIAQMMAAQTQQMVQQQQPTQQGQ
jgi:hypothetical protein